MKFTFRFAAACIGAILLAAGCNKMAGPADSTRAPQAASRTAPAPGPQASPDVPKGAEAAAPVPGQANDHSSPTFKDGGKTDPHK